MVLSVLLRNEMLKMVKRLAFWVTFFCFAFVMIMEFGDSYFRAAGNPDRTWGLPGAWRDVLAGLPEVALICGSVILILLLNSEFSWRTARQNVIDGLSKEQFFVGKTILLPIVALIFIGTNIVVGGGFALAGTDFSALTEPLMGAVHSSLIGGFFLAFLGYGSGALFCSLAIRSSGPAMAVWFFYVALGEQLIAGLMNRIHERLGDLAEYLPINTFNQLHRYYQYDLAAYRDAVQRAVEGNDQPPDEPWAMGLLLVLSFAWIALLVGGSFFWFRKRDL